MESSGGKENVWSFFFFSYHFRKVENRVVPHSFCCCCCFIFAIYYFFSAVEQDRENVVCFVCWCSTLAGAGVGSRSLVRQSRSFRWIHHVWIAVETLGHFVANNVHQTFENGLMSKKCDQRISFFVLFENKVNTLTLIFSFADVSKNSKPSWSANCLPLS